jgi:aspartate/methionine/tyrosine aminotransferase
MAEVSNRLNGIGEYYFSSKLREIDELNKAGHRVINLGIGSPDLPPHPDVIQTLYEEASKPNTHAYQSYKGSLVLREAVAAFYSNWYHINVNPQTEVLPLIGSKEGIMHICMTYLNPGDGVLVPNPGYPTYSSAVRLAGGEVLPYMLTEENGWHPLISEWEELVQQYRSGGKGKVKLLFLNYPHMPTGQLPDKSLLEKMVDFAKREDILIIHDNPYSFILNEAPMSLFEFDTEKKVVVELNSLSKSHNMAGWRVGMIVASEEQINAILRFKSNMDSGMFLPVQVAAAKALQLDKNWFSQVNDIYRERKEQALKLLDLLGCSYSKDQVGMFVWAKIPAGYASGFELSDAILAKARVFITPGGIFGDAGNGFVRVSLCSKKEVLEEAISRVMVAGSLETN